VDAAQDYLQRRHSQGRQAAPVVRHSGIVLVQNNTGSDLDRFAVVGIDSPIISPTDNELSFTNQAALACDAPSDPTHLGQFAVLQEPLSDGKIGLAMVSGITPVKVDVVDEWHQCADIADGASGNLKSCQLGAARILWAEPGTGEQWAVVLLGDNLTERGLWAELTGHTLDGDNRWTYSWKEIKKTSTGYDGWSDISGGLTGSDNAYNSFEVINSAFGRQGNGVHIDNLAPGEQIQPCPNGTPVWLREVVTTSDDKEYWYDYANGVDEGSSSSSSSSSMP